MHVWYILHTHSTSYTCRNSSMHGARKKNTNKIGLWRCHSRCHFTRLLFFQQLKRKIESHALTPVPNKTCKFVVEKYRPNLLNIVNLLQVITSYSRTSVNVSRCLLYRLPRIITQTHPLIARREPELSRIPEMVLVPTCPIKHQRMANSPKMSRLINLHLTLQKVLRLNSSRSSTQVYAHYSPIMSNQ